MSYHLFIKLIKSGNTVGLKEKADVMFTLGRLTNEQYTEIITLLESEAV